MSNSAQDPKITVNGNTIDVTEPMHTCSSAQDSNYIYIVGRAHLTNNDKIELSHLGVKFHEYIDDRTYLCRYEPIDLEAIGFHPVIFAANVYGAQLKSEIDLKRPFPVMTTEESICIDVVLHQDAQDRAEDVANEIKQSTGLKGPVRVQNGYISLSVSSMDHIREIECVDSVKRIEEAGTPVFCNA